MAATLQTVADRTSWALPFEALYQDALYRITAESRGLTGLAIQLGPFGGSEAGGPNLPLWTIAYFAVVLAATLLELQASRCAQGFGVTVSSAKEGQTLIKERNRVPSSLAVDTHLNKFPFEMIDPVITLDESSKWEKLWSELFLKGQAIQREKD